MILTDKKLQHKIYTVIFESDTPAGKAFDVALIIAIIFSVFLVMLESVQDFSLRYRKLFLTLEWVFTFFFTIEYILRVYSSPKPKKYIFSFYGIIDFLATFPAYFIFSFSGAHYFMAIRAFRLLRIFRIFNLFNFLEEGENLLYSIRDSRRKIFVFFFFVVIIVISIGTVMYMIEGSLPDSQFRSIPSSIYWAVVTLTTVGYGDITPVTSLGRFLSACVMLLGYTIIAVPTGIVSVSMINARRKKRYQSECPRCHAGMHDDDAAFCKYCGEKLERRNKPSRAGTPPAKNA